MTRIQGLKIDEEKLAAGLYDLIPEDDKACMRFGMLPAGFMRVVEGMMREKLVQVQYPGWPSEDVKAAAALVRADLVGDVMRIVSAALIGEACKRGLCIA